MTREQEQRLVERSREIMRENEYLIRQLEVWNEAKRLWAELEQGQPTPKHERPYWIWLAQQRLNEMPPLAEYGKSPENIAWWHLIRTLLETTRDQLCDMITPEQARERVSQAMRRVEEYYC